MEEMKFFARQTAGSSVEVAKLHLKKGIFPLIRNSVSKLTKHRFANEYYSHIWLGTVLVFSYVLTPFQFFFLNENFRNFVAGDKRYTRVLGLTSLRKPIHGIR